LDQAADAIIEASAVAARRVVSFFIVSFPGLLFIAFRARMRERRPGLAGMERYLPLECNKCANEFVQTDNFRRVINRGDRRPWERSFRRARSAPFQGFPSFSNGDFGGQEGKIKPVAAKLWQNAFAAGHCGARFAGELEG
jgi:hypothetical protein